MPMKSPPNLPNSQRKHKNDHHYVPMRINRAAIVAMGVAITVAVPNTALAEPTPTSTTSSLSEYQSALNQYKLDLQQYRNLISDREQSRKSITQAFIVAVASANGAAKSALRTAKTADAKTAIGEQLKTSIRLASEARDSANTALGPLPIEPIKPVKLQEPAPLKKTKP